MEYLSHTFCQRGLVVVAVVVDNASSATIGGNIGIVSSMVSVAVVSLVMRGASISCTVDFGKASGLSAAKDTLCFVVLVLLLYRSDDNDRYRDLVRERRRGPGDCLVVTVTVSLGHPHFARGNLPLTVLQQIPSMLPQHKNCRFFKLGLYVGKWWAKTCLPKKEEQKIPLYTDSVHDSL